MNLSTVSSGMQRGAMKDCMQFVSVFCGILRSTLRMIPFFDAWLSIIQCIVIQRARKYVIGMGIQILIC